MKPEIWLAERQRQAVLHLQADLTELQHESSQLCRRHMPVALASGAALGVLVGIGLGKGSRSPRSRGFLRAVGRIGRIAAFSMLRGGGG